VYFRGHTESGETPTQFKGNVQSAEKAPLQWVNNHNYDHVTVHIFKKSDFAFLTFW